MRFIAFVEPNKNAEPWRCRQHDPLKHPELRHIPQENEPSARNSNTADRTWNQTTVRPADWTEQLLCHCYPTNQVSNVQSQCQCLNDCSVVNFLMVACFSFRNRNLYSKQRLAWSSLNELTNCGLSRYADTSCSEVGLVLTVAPRVFSGESSSMANILPPHHWTVGKRERERKVIHISFSKNFRMWYCNAAKCNFHSANL
jgi:hypothetical protein